MTYPRNLAVLLQFGDEDRLLDKLRPYELSTTEFEFEHSGTYGEQEFLMYRSRVLDDCVLVIREVLNKRNVIGFAYEQAPFFDDAPTTHIYFTGVSRHVQGLSLQRAFPDGFRADRRNRTKDVELVHSTSA